MNKQILFFDIDGTLIPQRSDSLPASAANAISLARENGHIAVVNTARTYSSIQDCLKKYPFDGYICGCSTNIILNGESVYTNRFPDDVCNMIVDGLLKYGFEAFIEGTDDIYSIRERFRIPAMEEFRKYYEKRGLCCTRFAGEDRLIFDKFIYMTEDADKSEEFLSEIKGHVDIIRHGHGVYECPPKGCTKAVGMSILADCFHIDMKDTWAFGDSLNDQEMLSVAGHGVVMGVHASELEQYAEIITDNVENDGLAKALKKAGLI